MLVVKEMLVFSNSPLYPDKNFHGCPDIIILR